MAQLPYFQSDNQVLNMLQTKWMSILNPLLKDNVTSQQNVAPGAAILPTGTMLPFAGKTAPDGFILCDGSSYSTAQYPDLFKVIGTTYGGSGNFFNVPNTQGVFLRGAGSQTISGITYTGTQGTVQGDQFQGHAHLTSATAVQFTSGAGNYAPAASGINANKSGPANQSDGTNGTPRTGTETRPANITVLYIIKT